MSNYNSLKATIDANIKQNGNQEITGQILNSVLNQMVTTLGAGYQFAGVATIDTNPGTPDAKVFYIANGKGTYEKFGGINVTEDDVVVLYWDSSWHKVSTGIASDQKLSELKSEVQNTESRVNASQKALESRVNTEIKDFKDAVTDQVENYKPIVINGNVTNAADEEDITSEDNLLKLKDRSALNGMGYVILRKNKTFAEQVTQANTIYEIRYDFNLEGLVFSLPSNIVLSFKGGIISNATLIGNEVSVESSSYQIFSNVKIKNRWLVDKWYVNWFGVKGDGVTDNTNALQNLIDNVEPYFDEGSYPSSLVLYFPLGTYNFGGEVTLKSFISLLGDGKVVSESENSGTRLVLTSSNSALFRIKESCRNIRFNSLNFFCYSMEGWGNSTIAILCKPTAGLQTPKSSFGHKLDDCSFVGFAHHLYIERAIDSSDAPINYNWQCDGWEICNNTFMFANKSCISCHSSNGLDYSSINNCSFSIYGEEGIEKFAIDLERCGFLSIRDCAFSSVNYTANTGMIYCADYTNPLTLESLQGESIALFGRLKGITNIIGCVFDAPVELYGTMTHIYGGKYNASPSIKLQQESINLRTDAPFSKIRNEALNNYIEGMGKYSIGYVDSTNEPIAFPIVGEQKVLDATNHPEGLSVDLLNIATKRRYFSVLRVSILVKITGSGKYTLIYNKNVGGQQYLIQEKTTDSAETLIIRDTSNYGQSAKLQLFAYGCSITYNYIIESYEGNVF